MTFYIIDDDLAIIKVLENIIEENNLGEVIGHSESAEEGVKDIILKKPDIVLVDLLMPEKDGIDIVNEVKCSNIDVRFIMISQVSSKSMISKAYNSGIEFFINKPINVIEVTRVINIVSEKIQMEKTLKNIKGMFDVLDFKNIKNKTLARNKNIKIILSKLGVMGEKGGEDILNICRYLIENKKKSLNINISEICEILDKNPRAMEQRIRRTINRALSNIANIGIEDYLNDSFTNYSNSLFNFEDVKAEMDFIRGKKSTGGKISVKKFINGLLLYNEL